MIVASEDSTLVLVTQSDHAHVSGQLLALWRDDGLPGNPRREEILFAAREHDNGWREADAAPLVDPTTGAPYDFLTLPAAERAAIWRRGVERHRAARPYAALLIHQHALELHRDAEEDGHYHDLLEELRGGRAELLEETGVAEPVLLADYALIRLADALSLAACGCFPGERSIESRRFRLERGELWIEPLPFAGSTTFRVPFRRIERRRYADALDLAAALVAAPWERFEMRVRPRYDRER